MIAEELARAWMSVASIIARAQGMGTNIGDESKRLRLLEMSALQLRPATHVGPMVFVVQVVVPVLLAPLVGGESWSSTPLGGGVIVLAAAAVATCAVVLMRSPAVAKFADEAARG